MSQYSPWPVFTEFKEILTFAIRTFEEWCSRSGTIATTLGFFARYQWGALEACQFATPCQPMPMRKHFFWSWIILIDVVTSQTSPWDWNTSAFVDAASVRSEKNDSVMHERSAFQRWCALHLLLARGLKHVETSSYIALEISRARLSSIDRYDDTFHRTHWPWP